MSQITHTINFEFANNVKLEEIKELFRKKHLGDMNSNSQKQIVYSYAQLDFETLVNIYHAQLSTIGYAIEVIDMKEKVLRVEKQL